MFPPIRLLEVIPPASFEIETSELAKESIVKGVIQNLKNGSTEVWEMPSPGVEDQHLRIRSVLTLVSSGTERMLVEFGKAGWIEKARQQPDKVRQVVDKVKTDGFLPTLDAVRSKLDQPLSIGYCNVGVVIDVGAGVEGFAIGDRVASNGRHAEVVSVPKNLCARIPDSVSNEQAVFTVLAAIGLQGIRLAAPTLGEYVVVTGLGLIGLLTVQMLRAQGCKVLGLDFDPDRLVLAQNFGAQVANLQNEDPVSVGAAFSGGRGVDAVIITASTQSNEPVSQAARMCRKRGRIVLVGVAGLNLSRSDFYEKELTFQVSCSYGPGRYDPEYEDYGRDYPIGFVRWTEQRNFEAVLDLMSSGAFNIVPLISHSFALEQAPEAYSVLTNNEPSLGILLKYPKQNEEDLDSLTKRRIVLSNTYKKGATSVGFLGAGNYSGRVLIPAFKAAGAGLHTLVSEGGISATHHGRKYGFNQVSTDVASVLANPEVESVVIGTRHDSHARYVGESLRAGKHVFVEKPLCLTLEELDAIDLEIRKHPDRHLMVGFNRRFAPQVLKMKALLNGMTDPKVLVMTVNAGAIPRNHWTQDRTIGGGRIIGEGCHFIDLMRHLVGFPIVDHSTMAMNGSRDTITSTLRFMDGSIGTLQYFANGSREFPKERLEIFCNGRVLQLDNFRKLRGWGWKGFSRMNLWRQDKGALSCVKAFMASVLTGDPSPIPVSEIIEVTRVSIEIDSAIG